MEKSKIIFNSSPLINLSKIEKLELVEKLFGKIIIPEAVFNELIKDASSKKGSREIKDLINKGVVEVRKVEDENIIKSFRKDLDHGEAEVITLALEINADLIIIDEIEARRVAEIYNLKKTGFIGLLIKAYNKKYIDNFKELLDLAIQKGFWINKNLYKNIINKFE